MLTVDFLRTIWPSQGFYCLATPRRKDDRVWWHHASFATIEEACDSALSRGQTQDMYFTILSLREKWIIDKSKIDKAKTEGRVINDFTARSYRTHSNIAWARSFFIDLDVGKTDGYPTQQVAFEALKVFLKATHLPRPWIVSSGVGLHVYWPMAEDIAADEWRPIALKLKALCRHHGLKSDPVRTADVASVLRVPGTQHLKDPLKPKRVAIIKHDGPITPFDEWQAAISRAHQLTPTGEFHDADVPLSMQQMPVSIDKLKQACALSAELIDDPMKADEPRWYKMLGLLKFTEGGTQTCHDISRVHPHYEPEWINKKLEQLDRVMFNGGRMGPTTCRMMSETCGTEHCEKCWFSRTSFYKDGGSSPIVAARRLPLDTVAGVPPPPQSYMRTSGGVLRETAEGPQIICPFDLYPIAAIENKHNETRASSWMIHIPRKEPQTLIIDNIVANDTVELSRFLASKAFLPHFDEVKGIKQYMTAYLRDLQKYCDDHQQYAKFGWTTEQKGFVLGEQEFVKGKAKPALIGGNARKVSESLAPMGSLHEQRKLMRFYLDPAYVGHQFMIGASLASPLFYLTGQYGTVVNMTGPSGASKSTALFTAGSLWGRPETYVMTATDNGATIQARNAIIASLCNLPVCVDETTLMSAEDLRSMIMGFSQQQAEKARLKQNAEFRTSIASTKSTLMLTTSNNSIHEMLSYRNSAGTAGSMRLFEITAASPPPSTTKEEADRFIMQCREHYGWIGIEWIKWVTANMAEVAAGVTAEKVRLDRLCEMQAAERFWSAVAAVTIYSLKRAHALELLPFDPGVVEHWLLNHQLASMRQAVITSYSSSLDTLLAYLASAANSMALMGVSSNGKPFIDKNPSGELAGGLRTDIATATLYMSHLRAYATRERIQLNALIRELETKGLVRKMRVDPVAGTIYSTGAQPCLQVDLKHPSIAGHERVDEIGKVVAIRRTM